MFPGDLVVVENPWESGKLLVRRVKSISSSGPSPSQCVVWVASETVNGGIDSKVFGPIPVQSVLGRACYYYNNDKARYEHYYGCSRSHILPLTNWDIVLGT